MSARMSSLNLLIKQNKSISVIGGVAGGQQEGLQYNGEEA
jgi:hypothetical protein